MASRKTQSTAKNVGSKRTANRTEASTDNARASRTTAKKTSRTKNCN